MNLIEEIVTESLSKRVDVPRLLRLCFTLGRRAKYDRLIDWSRQELAGYPPETAVPTYRRYVYVSSHTQVTAAMSPGQPSYVEIREGVAMVHAASPGVTPNGEAAVLDQLTTRILDFALTIEAQVTGADRSLGSVDEPSKEILAEAFATTIARDLVVELPTRRKPVPTGYHRALLVELGRLGFTERDLAGVLAALDADRGAERPETLDRPGFTPFVAEWFAKYASACKSGTQASAVAKLLLEYFGIAGGTAEEAGSTVEDLAPPPPSAAGTTTARKKRWSSPRSIS
jgi:hypothetical protein